MSLAVQRRQLAGESNRLRQRLLGLFFFLRKHAGQSEGVENVDSYNKLAELGCDYAQGYFLSRPLSPEKATLWLEEFTGVVREEEPPAAEEPTLGEWMLEAPIDDAPLDEAPLDEAPA